MASSVLEQYTIADLVEWYDQKKLRLNPNFQRRSIWTAPAKVYLIDTILQRLPIHKVYMRTLLSQLAEKPRFE